MRLCALNTHLLLSLLAFTAGIDPASAAQSLQARQQNNSDSISTNCQNGACTTTICQNNLCTVCSNGSCTTSTQGQASPTKANTGTLTSTPATTGTGKSTKKKSSTNGFTLTFTGTVNPSATRESSSESAGSSRKGLSIGAIVGIAIAGTVVLGLLMMCLLSRRASARQKRSRPRGTMLMPASRNTSSTSITPNSKVSDSEEMGESTMNQSLLAAAARPAALRASHQSWASAPPQSPYTPHNLRAGYPPENIYTNELTQSPTRVHTADPRAGGRNYHSVYDLAPEYGNLPSPHNWTPYNSSPVQGMFGADGLASTPSGTNRRPGSNPTNQRALVGHSHSTPTHAELVNYQNALERDDGTYGARRSGQPSATQDSPSIYYSQH